MAFVRGLVIVTILPSEWHVCETSMRMNALTRFGRGLGAWSSTCRVVTTVMTYFAVTMVAWSADATWQPVASIPVDLPPQELVESLQTVDACEDVASRWTVAVGDQHAEAKLERDVQERHGGTASLRVDYQFVGKKEYEYVQLNGSAEFAKPGLGFGFWLKHDGTPFVVRVRLTDAGGECHQIETLHSAEAGWQYVVGWADGPSTSWGGDGNGRKDFPLKLAGICLDRPRVGFTGTGSLWLDDVDLVRRREIATRSLVIETQSPRFGNVYSVGDTVALRAHGDGDQIRWQVTDFFGREVASGEGAAGGAEWRFTLSQPGWFSCRCDLLADGRVVVSRQFSCAALPDDTDGVRSEFVGVCSHFGQNAYPLETMELMLRYGIDQFRDEISWRSCEPEKGRFVLPEFAKTYLGRAAALHLRPLIIFDYNNPHYDNDGFPNSAEAIAGFADYAVALARETRGSVATFEVWNEWVGGCGMNGRAGEHDGAAYGRLLAPTYAAVKQAFPDVTVVGMGGEYGAHCSENILGAIGTAGPHAMDAWSIHPYRYPHPPESSDLMGEVARIGQRVAEGGVKSKAWITEIGYPTHRTSGGSSELAQARLCVRTLALLQASPVVEKVFWYDFKNDGLNREYNEHNFGLVHHQDLNCAPKPAVVALSAFIWRTADAQFVDLQQRDGLCCSSYRRPDNTDLLLIWTERGTRRVKLTGKIDHVWDLMGNSLPAESQWEASENVVYVQGAGVKLAE